MRRPGSSFNPPKASSAPPPPPPSAKRQRPYAIIPVTVTSARADRRRRPPPPHSSPTAAASAAAGTAAGTAAGAAAAAAAATAAAAAAAAAATAAAAAAATAAPPPPPAASPSVCPPSVPSSGSGSGPGSSSSSSASASASACSSSSPSPSSSRPPLRLKDGNLQDAPLLTARKRSTIASAAAAAKMPVGDRPRQPQLATAAAAAAAAARSAKRSPLTPKVAVKRPASTAPLVARRPQSAQPPRDDGPPAGGGGSSSATPRSGLAQGLVDSAAAGTPTTTLGRADRLPPDGCDQPAAGDKFFYASDARAPSRPLSVPQRPLSVPQRPVTFFYANGASADARRTASPPAGQPLTPVLSPSGTQEPAASKFFYANEAPGLALPNPPAVAASTPTSSRLPAGGRPATTASSAALAAHGSQLSASPVKAAAPAPCGQMPNASTPMLSLSTSSQQSHATPSLPSPAPDPSSAVGRRVSIDAAPRFASKGHVRAGSASTVDPPPASKLAVSPASSQPSSPPSLSPGSLPPQAGMTMASLIQAAEELKDGDPPAAELASPTRSSFAADSVTELVARARRERKVQDLEITNASLEAINRTLERQLRKQTAELRRYRRLSRSGRISAVASRTTSAALSDPALDLSSLTEEGEEGDEEPGQGEAPEDGEQEEEEEEEEQDDDGLDSLDDSDLSSNESLSADKLAVRRKRDERRLQLDLTRHQELLVDSQKMNQSLKRCLDWTEELIREGQKALAYRVRASDVELGGRVLAPPEDDGGAAPRLAPPWTKGPQDRDSGIDLPVDGG